MGRRARRRVTDMRRWRVLLNQTTGTGRGKREGQVDIETFTG